MKPNSIFLVFSVQTTHFSCHGDSFDQSPSTKYFGLVSAVTLVFYLQQEKCQEIQISLNPVVSL